jgi:hypothetical protein
MSVLTEQLRSYWTDFLKILYLNIFFLKSVKRKIHVSLEYGKNDAALYKELCTLTVISR